MRTARMIIEGIILAACLAFIYAAVQAAGWLAARWHLS